MEMVRRPEEYQEGAEHVETDKVDYSKVAAAGFLLSRVVVGL